jgi:hypothetical protein
MPNERKGNQYRAGLFRKTSSRQPRTHLHVGRDRVRDDPRISIRIHNSDGRDIGDVAFLDQRQVLGWVEDDDNVREVRAGSDGFGSEAAGRGSEVMKRSVEIRWCEIEVRISKRKDDSGDDTHDVLGQTVRQRSRHPSFPCHPKPIPFQPLHSLPDHSPMPLPRPDKQHRSVPLHGPLDKLASTL